MIALNNMKISFHHQPINIIVIPKTSVMLVDSKLILEAFIFFLWL